MQGSWIVRVKSKSAAFPQRFVISGATTGNGTYTGVVSTPDVWVSGNHWTITIQNDPGTGFRPSVEQVKFPVVSGGNYWVDIESDDGGVSGPDMDFNDLILTCYTPVTDEDFLVYGHISHYSDGCLINPCFPRYVVIDNWKSLYAALRVPHLKEVIEKLYPEKTWRIPPIPDPDPAPFKPLMIPLFDETPVPDKKYQILQVARQEFTAGTKKSKGEAMTMSYNAVRSSEEAVLIRQENRHVFEIDKVKLGSIFDRLRLNCETGPIPGAYLKFYEYDRTSSEMAGGAYTGDGSREYLGFTQADHLGNYVFRFRRSIAQFVTEAIDDTASGEDAVKQSMPDLILFLADPFNISHTLYESGCYWNIPLLKRINLCIPYLSAGLIPQPCDGQSVIQRIGNTVLGPLDPVTLTRVGSGNYLTADGKITAYHYLAPQVRCAAWRGSLAIWGCLKNKDIKWYTIRHKTSTSGWTMHSANFTLPKYFYIGGSPVLANAFVGPYTKQLKLNSSVKEDCYAYLNVEAEVDPDWMASMRNLKAFLSSTALIDEKGPVKIRLEGFKDNGDKVADETVTLYIDNVGANAAIDPDITMAGETLGNCALFTLPKDVNNVTIENSPITVRFKAIQKSGFMNAYELYMYKGATGYFAVNPGVLPANFIGAFLDNLPNRGRTYQHTSNLDCDTNFKGTISEVTADSDGFYEVVLTPAGNWLEAGQTFCAFSLNLSGTTRHTNGSTGYGYFYGGQVLIGIQR